jgi:hypothetical protein
MQPDERLLEVVIKAVASAWEHGCPVAGHAAETQAEIARRAVRRWRSSARRGISQEDRADRLRDLAEGLVAEFEPDPCLVGPLRRDYEYLAATIAAVMPGS